MQIDITLVHRLVKAQFPQWQNLPIQQVSVSGWDNRTFHLGNDMLIRMPSAESYATQVEKNKNGYLYFRLHYLWQFQFL